MKNYSHLLAILLLLPGFAWAGFPFGDPPDAHHPWTMHDDNRPQPPRVEPGAEIGAPPSDAIVLFDGTAASLKNWRHLRPDEKRKKDWIVQDGYMLVTRGAGNIASREEFGDCQLHIEWSHEKALPGNAQNRGNSGVFLLGRIEVQVLDNFNNPTYADGTAGAIYGVMPPAANALHPPGKWQSYDIIFRRPIIKHGEVLDEGSMTVLMNGVVIQDSTPLDGGGGWRQRTPVNTPHPDKGPLVMQDHGDPVRFRNIWYRPLRPRPVDGGADGRLSSEATQAKRLETAGDIRNDAAQLDGFPKMLRLLEAYIYDPNEAAWGECDALVSAYVKELLNKDKSSLQPLQHQAKSLHQALSYLQQHRIISPPYAPAASLKALALEQGWIKK